MMRATKLDIQAVRLPLARPIPSGRMTIHSADALLVSITTKEGLIGEGMVFTLNGHRLGILREMIRSLEPILIDADLEMSGALWAKMWADIGFIGHRGLATIAMSAIDMAVWDLKGKKAGLNVSALLGACKDRLPIYRSGGLRLSQTIDELQVEAQSILHDGFRAVKMSLGNSSLQEDVHRVRAVRDVLGYEVALMTDCNQSFSISHAIRLGRELEEYQLSWIEEPIPYHNHAGEAVVAQALDTPIASGENEFTRLGMIEMMKHRSADILMPDLQRMGGPTELIKVAHAAELLNIPVALHLFAEMSLALSAAMPNAIYVEYMPWFAPLYSEGLEFDGSGNVLVSSTPGWGFSFDAEAVKKYQHE